MYTYKRFKTSKSALIIVMMALALVVWGILGPTDALLAKKGGSGKASFTVVLDLQETDLDGNPVGPQKTFGGTADWPTLDLFFLDHGDFIDVGGKPLDLAQMSLDQKRRHIVLAQVFLVEDNEERTPYSGWTDVGTPEDPEPMPELPDVGGSFTVTIDRLIDIHKAKGKGNPGEYLGTVRAGYAVYTRTE